MKSKESNLSSILGAASGRDKSEVPEANRRQSGITEDDGVQTKKYGTPQTANTESGKTTIQETPKTVNTGTDFRRGAEKLVHITIEVPLTYRHHWKIESARSNRSFRDVAVEAFTKEFGLPIKGE